MTDRAGFFAGCADILTEMSIYYVVAGILIMSQRGWGLHLIWLLLCAGLCAGIYALVLKKPRTISFLTILTGLLFVAVMAVYILASTTPPTFGYVFVLAIGGGMTVGLPLYYGMNRPLVYQHLTHLDVLILALLGLLLCQNALGIGGSTVGLMVIVLLLDAASAVGLRMTDGGPEEDGKDAFKAMMVALAAAAAVFILILLVTAIFSHSGSVTGGFFHTVGSFLSSIGTGIENFFRWFSQLFAAEETLEAIPLEGEIPSVASIESAGSGMELSVNSTALGIGLCALIVAAAVIIVVVMGKKTVSKGTKPASAASQTTVTRTGGTLRALWQMLKKALRFRWASFRQRNTPRGLLVILERQARHRHIPRQQGESARHFIQRMDSSGGLNTLAQALDREFYAGDTDTLSPKACRELRKYMKKVVSHG